MILLSGPLTPYNPVEAHDRSAAVTTSKRRLTAVLPVTHRPYSYRPWQLEHDVPPCRGQHRIFRASDGGHGRGRTALSDIDGDGDVDIAVAPGEVLLQQRTHPAGISPFGIGTPGCGGVYGATTTHSAHPGNADFALVATNAPRELNIGVCYIATAGAQPGIYVAPLDFTYHVDVFTTAFLVTIPVARDATNAVFAPLSIPASAAPLVGTTFYAQMKFWLRDDVPCQPSLFDLTTGPGIAFTLMAAP